MGAARASQTPPGASVLPQTRLGEHEYLQTSSQAGTPAPLASRCLEVLGQWCHLSMRCFLLTLVNPSTSSPVYTGTYPWLTPPASWISWVCTVSTPLECNLHLLWLFVPERHTASTAYAPRGFQGHASPGQAVPAYIFSHPGSDGQSGRRHSWDVGGGRCGSSGRRSGSVCPSSSGRDQVAQQGPREQVRWLGSPWYPEDSSCFFHPGCNHQSRHFRGP